MCRDFSLFLFVYEIIPSKVGQWETFVVPSGDNASRFDASISEERFGQISLKYVKSTYRINSFEYGEFAQKQKPCFR